MKYRRLVIGIAAMAALIYLARSLTIPDCATIQANIKDLGLAAPLVYFVLYVIATVAFVPGTIVTMLAGLAFGPVLGTLMVSVSSVAGAVTAFLIARYLARDAVEGFLGKQVWFGRFKESLESNGFNFVLFVRLVPLFPFNGLNYACGIVPLKFRDYLLGSFLGMLPGTIAYVYAGSVVGCAIIDSKSGIDPGLKLKLSIALALLALLSVVPLFIKKMKKKSTVQQ
jgi:uncharacterized membrane protein YdjX (TVP38/TMEM64 family)